MSKKYDHGFGYDESSSSNANEDSEDSGNYFGRKNKPNYYQPQMSKTGNKYDVNNPSYSKNMFIPNQNYKTSSNFGGGLNLGSLGGMNFNSTFNTKKDDMYNIDVNTDKYKKKEDNDLFVTKNEEKEDKKSKKKKEVSYSKRNFFFYILNMKFLHVYVIFLL